MSVGNVTQAVDLQRDNLTLVLGNNLDLGGDGSRNGTGKTTLINALLGDNILPTALKACTAVVTKVRAIQNDEQPSIQVLFKNSGRRTATINELGDILTFDRVDNDDEP